MDKLSEHAIRMLEIEGKGKNDGYIETRNMGEIARAVYDVILQVQMLKRADRKTEPSGYKTKPVEDEPQTEDLIKQADALIDFDKELLQTDCAWGRENQPRTVPLYPMTEGEE